MLCYAMSKADRVAVLPAIQLRAFAELDSRLCMPLFQASPCCFGSLFSQHYNELAISKYPLMLIADVDAAVPFGHGRNCSATEKTFVAGHMCVWANVICIVRGKSDFC